MDASTTPPPNPKAHQPIIDPLRNSHPSVTMNVLRARMDDQQFPNASPRINLRRIRSRKIDDDDIVTTRHAGESDSGLPWIDSLWQRVQDSSGHRSSGAGAGCTVFKVPGEMRRQSPRLYQPSIVSIGPYHCGYGRGRDPQFAEAQVFKWSCLAHLLRRQSHVDPRDSLERCIDEMRALEATARACYARTVEMEENEYVEMLLLDGCFLLHLILDQPRRPAPGPDVDDFEDELPPDVEGPKLPTSWARNRVLYDILLLENQIPFFVVQHLFFLLKTPREANVSLFNMALDLFANLYPKRNPEFTVTPSIKVHHLLHLFYLSILPTKERKWVDGLGSEERILDARALIGKGVRLKKRVHGKDPYSFLDLRFDDGVIEVPCLHVWDYSLMLFSNLVAFEQCYPHASGHVMAYIAFMDLVVNNRRKGGGAEGVFVNMLRGDKRVGEFFEGLCSHVSIDCAAGYLMDLLEEASKFRRSRWKWWLVDCGVGGMAAAVAAFLLGLVFLQVFLFMNYALLSTN